MLDSSNAAVAIEVFHQNLVEIENEINALTTIKSVIKSFTERLNIEPYELQIKREIVYNMLKRRK